MGKICRLLPKLPKGTILRCALAECKEARPDTAWGLEAQGMWPVGTRWLEQRQP